MKELNSWREQDVHKEVLMDNIVQKPDSVLGGGEGGVFNNHNVNVLNRLTNLFKRRHWNYPSYNSIP